MRKLTTFPLIAAVALSLTVATACGPKQVDLPAAPAALVGRVDQDLNAATVKALGILQATGTLVEKIVDVEAQFAPMLPSKVHAEFLTKTNKLAVVAISAIDAMDACVAGPSADMKTCTVTDWPTLKAKVDPVVKAAGQLVDIVKKFDPAARQTSGFNSLIEIVGQLAGALIFQGSAFGGGRDAAPSFLTPLQAR